MIPTRIKPEDLKREYVKALDPDLLIVEAELLKRGWRRVVELVIVFCLGAYFF